MNDLKEKSKELLDDLGDWAGCGCCADMGSEDAQKIIEKFAREIEDAAFEKAANIGERESAYASKNGLIERFSGCWDVAQKIRSLKGS